MINPLTPLQNLEKTLAEYACTILIQNRHTTCRATTDTEEFYFSIEGIEHSFPVPQNPQFIDDNPNRTILKSSGAYFQHIVQNLYNDQRPENRLNYGATRLYAELRKEGEIVSFVNYPSSSEAQVLFKDESRISFPDIIEWDEIALETMQRRNFGDLTFFGDPGHCLHTLVPIDVLLLGPK